MIPGWLVKKWRRNIRYFLGTTTKPKYRYMVIDSDGRYTRQILFDGEAVMIYTVQFAIPLNEAMVKTDKFMEKSKGAAQLSISPDNFIAETPKGTKFIPYISKADFKELPSFGNIDIHPTHLTDDLKSAYRKISYQPLLVEEGFIHLIYDGNLWLQAFDEYTASAANTFADYEIEVAVPFRSFAHIVNTLPPAFLYSMMQTKDLVVYAKNSQEQYIFSVRTAKHLPLDIPVGESNYFLNPSPIVEFIDKYANGFAPSARIIKDEFQIIVEEGTLSHPLPGIYPETEIRSLTKFRNWIAKMIDGFYLFTESPLRWKIYDNQVIHWQYGYQEYSYV